MKKALTVTILALFYMLIASTAGAQNTPAPVSSTLSFSIGANAMGLGGASAAVPATDVTLELNPGFSGFGSNANFISDNLLAPGANLQFYGGGTHLCLFGDCPRPIRKLPGILAPLSLHIGGSVGVSRIVPSTGPAQSHVGFMLGGELKWTTSPGVQITLLRVDDCHFPGAPWGSNAPCISGGISYLFGKR